MIKKISLDNKSEMEKWDRFVKSHPNGSPFHLSNWLRAIYETYSFKPLLYIYKDGKDGISGVLPCFLINSIFTGRRIVSLPFSDYGGPLLNESLEGNDVLTEIIKLYGHKIRYIEIRSSMDENCSCFSNNYFKRHVLNLQSDLSDIKKGINKKTILYNIRKAQKQGVEIKEENNQYGIDEFYRLNLLTRKKHGVPPQPKKFFLKVFEHIISKGNGFIVLANYGSNVLAASLFIKFEKQIYYKYNASDPEYLKRASPNHLITWRVIEKGVREGFHSLDFGRTPNDNKGLIRYKEMWGMKGINCCYSYYPKIRGLISKREKSWLYRSLTGIWGSLPDMVINKIGAILYKHTA